MPEIVNKLDYRIRQTRECVYCQNPCNGSILNLSKVDLLFSDIVKWDFKIEWTEQSTHFQINYGNYNCISKRESIHSLLITMIIC